MSVRSFVCPSRFGKEFGVLGCLTTPGLRKDIRRRFGKGAAEGDGRVDRKEGGIKQMECRGGDTFSEQHGITQLVNKIRYDKITLFQI